MLSPSPIFGLCLSVFFPLLIQAQSVSDTDERPVTTIRSTITVVPIAPTATVSESETTFVEESAVIIFAPAPYDDTSLAPSGTGAADDNLGTITVTASPPTSPTPTTAVCNAGRVTCPACDGEEVTVDTMSFYTVNCDASLSSDSLIEQPSYITPSQCLLVCESMPDCVGTTLSSDGTCLLVVGLTYKVESSLDSDIAFVRVPYLSLGGSNSTNSNASNPLASKFFSSASFTLKPYPTAFPIVSAEGPPVPLPSPINVTYPNATAYYPTYYPIVSGSPVPLPSPINVTFPNATAYSSYPTTSGAPTLNLPKPIYTNFTLPNATHSANATYPTNTPLPINGTCSISNPTCPACDNQTLVDNHNVTYTVFCGYSLDATLDFAFGEPTPAAYCMSRCDERNSTCFGASWSTEECVLALGDFVGMIVDPDHMAFVRAALPQVAPYANQSTTSSPLPPLSTGLSWQNMSRYDDANSAPAPTSTLIVATGQTFTASLLLPTGPAVQPVPTGYPSARPSYGPVVKPSSAPESTDEPWTGDRPPWAHGHGGYRNGGGHRQGPPDSGSWWKGGRPPWAHWGGGRPTCGANKNDREQQE